MAKNRVASSLGQIRDALQGRNRADVGMTGEAIVFRFGARSVRVVRWSIAIGWLFFLAAIAARKPGELLELTAVTAVAPAAWWVARQALGAAPIVALVVFVLPLVDTWPARLLQLAPDRLPVPLPALLSVGSMVVVVAFIVLRPRVSAISIPVLALGAPFLLAGALSAVAAQNHFDALAQAWLAFAIPVAVGLLVASTRPTWAVATTLLLGFFVPTIVGIAAYVLSFGLPLSGADLVRAKVELYRPHLFQELTYGNVGHIADLALLLLPVAFLAPVAWRRNRLMQIASMAIALMLLIVLVLVLSRSTLIVALVMLGGVGALLAIRRRRRDAIVPAVGVAMVALVLLLPEVRQQYSGILPQASFLVPRATDSRPPRPRPIFVIEPAAQWQMSGEPAGHVFISDTCVVPVAAAVLSGLDTSTKNRIEAIRKGIILGSTHLLGVGTGQYVLFDPLHTAPHSLLVLLLVENGVLGAVGLLLLLGVLLARLFRVARFRSLDDGALLQLGALAGTIGFIGKGIIAGVPFAVGSIDVWAACLWSLVAIGMSSTTLVPLPERAPLIPVRHLATLALALGALSIVAVAGFPHALEPGNGERGGVRLNSLVDSGDTAGPNDWYRGMSALQVTSSRSKMQLVQTQPADLQPLVLSRPIPVFHSSCYDIYVSRIVSTTPITLAVGDEEARQVLQSTEVSSGRSDHVELYIRSGGRSRVSIMFIASSPINVEIGTVQMIRVTKCP